MKSKLTFSSLSKILAGLKPAKPDDGYYSLPISEETAQDLRDFEIQSENLEAVEVAPGQFRIQNKKP